MEILLTIINILLILILPFLMVGIIKKTKAFWAGRKGVNLLQPLWDFIKLLKKDAVYSKTTSWVFRLYPIFALSSVIFASLFVPIVNGISIIDFPFAFIIFAYILGLSKLFSLLSALDTGSSFEGMGASREACFSTIVEPAFFIGMASITALTQNYSFYSFKTILNHAGVYGYLIIILMALTLFIMLLIEGCRVPVDDPTTHLELTMIHEVMILDNSGVDLGFITWASYIKMFLFVALITNLLLPANLPILTGFVCFLGIAIIISALIGTLESAIARFRMTHVFEFIFIMSLTALLVLSLVTYRLYGN